MSWLLRVDTYENRDRSPVLSHVFYGPSKADALGTFRAHLKTDSFLRAAETTGRFRGFAVRNRRTWTRY